MNISYTWRVIRDSLWYDRNRILYLCSQIFNLSSEFQCNLSYPCFRGCLDGKESACNAGDPGSNPGSGRSPGEGNSNPFQYSCLENSMDRGAWQVLWGCKESDTIGQLTHTYTHMLFVDIVVELLKYSTKSKIFIEHRWLNPWVYLQCLLCLLFKIEWTWTC